VITHVLIIYRELPFAISIKQALERTGNYEVHPFVTPSAALEYLAQNPHDVVIIDFRHPQESGSSLVNKVRTIQADIAVIATPRQDDRVTASLSLNGSINAPFTARDIMPLINKAVEGTGRTTRLGESTSKPTRKLSREEMPPTTPNAVTRPSQHRPPDLPEYTPLQNLFSSSEMPAVPAEDDVAEDFEPPELSFEDFSIFEEDEDEADFVITPEDFPHRAEKPPSKIDTSDLFADMVDSGALSTPDAEVEAEQPSVDELTFDLPLQDVSPPKTDDLFSSVLGTINPEDDRPRGADQFETLVNSMRPQQEQRPPLTARQVEFTFGGDMDALLSEIERQRKETTSNLPEIPPDMLAAEPEAEPAALDDDDFFTTPLEEAGTVSDLVGGVTDPGFRNVLAALRGEEVIEEEESDSVVYSSRDLQDAFASYYESGAAEPSRGEQERRTRQKSPLAEEVDDLFAEVEADLRRGEEPRIEPEPEGTNTARLVLESTEDESFSISELISSIEKQLPEHRPKVQPLPSWVKEGKSKKGKRRKALDEDIEKFVSEPDFLPEFPPEPEPSDVFEFDTTQFIAGIEAEEAAMTVPHDAAVSYLEAEDAAESSFTGDDFDLTTMSGRGAEVVEKPGDLETESMQFRGDPDADDFDDFGDFGEEKKTPKAPSSLPEFEWGEAFAEAVEELGPTHGEDDEQRTPQFGSDLVPEPDEVEVEAPTSPYAATHIDDPYIAQLALSLTDVSLELTAEATLLTRDGEIVAYAGRMPGEEIDELRAAIKDDWDAKPDEARIRFINLPASGKDFMLYSRRTDDELTLSLIFAGSTHLRDIQRQGKRIIEALRAVPDPATLEFEAEIKATMESLPVLTPEQEAMARSPYAYLWMLRDPNAQLSDRMGKALIAGMNLQLRQEAWRIEEIRAADEYVYLVAEVPGETPPYEVIRDLKRRAAEIVVKQNPQLDPASVWADSYLIVTPGRRLEEDEIRQFIEFERMM
jgi:DNA-binding NarL/FixJ family response regulator